ncbi:hypothetical protein MRX96_021618 [Rhipicephalus microplus]
MLDGADVTALSDGSASVLFFSLEDKGGEPSNELGNGGSHFAISKPIDAFKPMKVAEDSDTAISVDALRDDNGESTVDVSLEFVLGSTEVDSSIVLSSCCSK